MQIPFLRAYECDEFDQVFLSIISVGSHIAKMSPITDSMQECQVPRKASPLAVAMEQLKSANALIRITFSRFRNLSAHDSKAGLGFGIKAYGNAWALLRPGCLLRGPYNLPHKLYHNH